MTEPIHVEAVATVVRRKDGELDLDWLLEGGLAALECEGVVLYIATCPLTDNNGSGDVYRTAQPAFTQQEIDALQRLRDQHAKEHS